MKVLVKSGYRAIAINPRGVEKSSGSLKGITVHDLAADVAGIIKALNAAPAHVLGHAFGNQTARCLAADYPKLVKSMKKSHFFATGCDPRVWRTGWYPDVAIPQLQIGYNTSRGTWWRAGDAPILIIQGLEDVLAPPANGRSLQQKLGDRVQLVELDHASHALIPEQPKIITDTILIFINDYRKKKNL